MRRVDKAAKVVGRAIEPRRGEQVDAVVAPAELAGKLGDRHHLDQRHAQFGQFRKLRNRGLAGPLRSEGAHVQFVDHLPREL